MSSATHPESSTPLGTCLNCGHGYDSRCSRCFRAFCCGNLGGRCAICGEGIIAHEVDVEYAVWLTENYEKFPHWRDEGNLEDPREDTTYRLKSEVTV